MEGIGTSVTPLARLPMSITARDDHDVKDVAVMMVLNDDPPISFPVDYVANGEAKKEVDLRDLNDKSKITIQPGQVLVLTVEVDDFFDLSSGTRKAVSNSIPLTVVTQDELLILLDRRELDLRNRLEQIIVELTQLQSLISKNLESSSTAPTTDEEESEENTVSSEDRMRLVRTQEAKIQVEKSMAELNGIAVQVAALNAELVNNRIDSTDRQLRLENQIRQAIIAVLDNEFVAMLNEIKSTESDLRDARFSIDRVSRTLDLNTEVVAKLNDILKNMLDIEDFNEVVDMLRDILQRQEELLEKTKEEQKQRALDLFK